MRLSLQAERELRFYAGQSKSLANFISILGTLLALIFSIGAVVGAMASRPCENGTLGFRRGAVRGAFLAESLLLPLAGGVLGLPTATVMQTVDVPTTNFTTCAELAFQFTLMPKIAVLPLLFALFTDFVGRFIPARRRAAEDRGLLASGLIGV